MPSGLIVVSSLLPFADFAVTFVGVTSNCVIGGMSAGFICGSIVNSFAVLTTSTLFLIGFFTSVAFDSAHVLPVD